jgi:hypothetical protein
MKTRLAAAAAIAFLASCGSNAYTSANATAGRTIKTANRTYAEVTPTTLRSYQAVNRSRETVGRTVGTAQRTYNNAPETVQRTQGTVNRALSAVSRSLR